AIEYIHAEILFCVTDGFHGFQGAPTQENGKPPEEFLLRLREKVVTPVDRLSKSLLPCWQVSCTAGQELEATGKSCPHSGNGQKFDTSSGKFDGERKAIQPCANLRDYSGILFGKFEIRFHRCSALDEERNRREPGEFAAGSNRFSIWQCEWRNWELMFVVDMESFTTGDQNFKAGCESEKFRK